MDKPLNVLLVEDVDADAELIILQLKRAGFQAIYQRVDTAEDFLDSLKRSWDLIISDYSMPKFSGKEALALLKQTDLDIPFIVVSATIGEENAVDMMKAGAGDYVLKDNLGRLVPAVQRELREASNRARQREVEASLRRNESLLTDFFETATLGLHWVGPDGTIIRANQAELNMLGYSPEEYIGHKISEFHTDPDVIQDILNRLKNNERLVDYPACLRAKDGTIKTVLINSSVYWEEEQFGHTRCFTRDITDLAHTKENLAETNKKLQLYIKRLEQSNRELEHFAMIASHDLQAPLRKVRFFSDHIQSKLEGLADEEIKDSIHRMQKAVARMQALIDDLLDLSRVNRKGKPFEKLDLSYVAREAVADLHEIVKETGGRVKIAEMLEIEGDPTQIHQLFSNLIENGLKFHKPDEAPVVVVSAIITDCNTCEIRVQDNGIGFDEKYLDRIFEVFQRLHGDDAYQGTGIGLALCKKIVERHGGEITASSMPDQGAIFIVRLPVKQSSTQTNEASARSLEQVS
jgi:PAS domain S-box-containing protein